MLDQLKISLKWSLVMTVLAGIVLASCSKMDGTYKDFIKDGEIRYGQKPDTLGIRPGHHRVEAWIAAKWRGISKFEVFWNNRADSVVVPIKGPLDSDTLRVTIDNLEEGSYTFEFFTYDREGNRSLVVDTIGYVYADEYNGSLLNRLINRATIGQNVRIIWYNQSNEEAIMSEVRYKRPDGTSHLIKVKPSDIRTVINEEILEESLEYRTVFVPHPSAIDTFYTDYMPITLVPHIVAPYEGFPETFEDTKYSKTNATSAEVVTIGSGKWMFNKFLIGNATGDRKNGKRALRSHTDESIFEMQEDFPDGASKISFYHGICSADGKGGEFQVQFSTNGGITWEDIGEEYTNTTTLVYREIPLDIEGRVRFRFVKYAVADCPTAACRMNLDDITIYNQ